MPNLRAIFRWIEQRITQPTDDSGERLRKTALSIADLMAFNAITTAFVALLIVGDMRNALVFGVIGLMNFSYIAFLFITRRFRPYLYASLIINAIGPMIIHTAFGGFTETSVLIWPGVTSCLAAAIFLPRRQAWIVFGLYALAVIGFYIADPMIDASSPGVPDRVGSMMTVLSLILPIAQIVTVISYMVSELEKARNLADDLLLNILPGSIAEQLKHSPATIADGHKEVTVLFADIVGFTEMSANADPVDVVTMLNTVFSDFDDLARKHGLEKIKTIGDAYMAAAGLPKPCADHAQRCVRAGLKMIAYIEQRNRRHPFKWTLRVGIHSGPVVAGVVGKRKYAFDIWGDTVNIASRMESSGEGMRVNVSAYTSDLAKGEFECEYRGKVAAKGKGEIDMYFIKDNYKQGSAQGANIKA